MVDGGGGAQGREWGGRAAAAEPACGPALAPGRTGPPPRRGGGPAGQTGAERAQEEEERLAVQALLI